MPSIDRRRFLGTSAWAAAAAAAVAARGAEPGRDGGTARFLAAEATLPRNRVPLSFIIDDSTCLVNMGHFCMPQFATAWPERAEYKKPWQEWPREIPDDFVRRFGNWCGEQGVKGKYSIVPYPACVGWLDRELPGWSRRDLQASLRLVRDLMLPNWDIHPEMITHTRVIDLASGRPMAEISAATMENSYPQTPVSVDALAEYLAYALRILKNCDLPCEGVTTPGGFGNRVKAELPLAVRQAVQDVYAVELPHYFKYIRGGDESTEPQLEAVEDALSDAPRITVNVPAGTGDWFGGWDGVRPSEGHRYANEDASAGRMVELIERRQPAVMLCHWPGIYCNGGEEGFRDFQQIVLALQGRFGEQTQWMKVSEIARYWAAKELTQLQPVGTRLEMRAPFACPQFTLQAELSAAAPLRLVVGDDVQPLRQVARPADLQAFTWCRHDDQTLACFDLPRGESKLATA